MALAVESEGWAWAVPPAQLRAAKEAIRARLYSAAERALRDRILGRLSDLFARWREAEPGTASSPFG